MQGMRHFTYSMPNFRISIYEISDEEYKENLEGYEAEDTIDNG